VKAGAADSTLTIMRVQPTQLQDEIIDTAHSAGELDPVTFARLLLHNLDDVHAAIRDLVDRGWLAAAEGDTYRLTEQVEDHHRARVSRHRAAVISRSRSW